MMFFRLPCWLVGHRHHYVGVENIVWKDDSGYLAHPCPHDYLFLKHCNKCRDTAQIARWMCRCGKMGETYIREGQGMFKPEFGRLVPDEKAWANRIRIVAREDGCQ